MAPSNNQPRKHARTSSPFATPTKRQQTQAPGGSFLSPFRKATADDPESIPSTPSNESAPSSPLPFDHNLGNEETLAPHQCITCKQCKQEREVIYFQCKNGLLGSCLFCSRATSTKYLLGGGKHVESSQNGGKTTAEVKDIQEKHLERWKQHVSNNMGYEVTEEEIGAVRWHYQSTRRFLEAVAEEHSQNMRSAGRSSPLTSPDKRASARKATENINKAYKEYPDENSEEPEITASKLQKRGGNCQSCRRTRPNFYFYDPHKHQISTMCLYCRLEDNVKERLPTIVPADARRARLRDVAKREVSDWSDGLRAFGRGIVNPQHKKEAYNEAERRVDEILENTLARERSMMPSTTPEATQAPREETPRPFVDVPTASRADPSTRLPRTPGSSPQKPSVVLPVRSTPQASDTTDTVSQQPITPINSPRVNQMLASDAVSDDSHELANAMEVLEEMRLILDEISNGAGDIEPEKWGRICRFVASRLDIQQVRERILEEKAEAKKLVEWKRVTDANTARRDQWWTP